MGRAIALRRGRYWFYLVQIRVRRTLDFIRSHRVVPIEAVNGALRLGMCDPFDLRTLDSIERITGRKPVPCLALEDEFEEFLERYGNETHREAGAAS